MVLVGKVKRLMATAVMLGSWAVTQAQVLITDSFADGNLTAQPTWTGRTGHFAVINQQLRLQAPPQAGSSSLFTPSTIAVRAQWEVALTLDYNPSSSNYAEFLFQVTDTASLSGYGIRVGGSTPDRISLLRYDQGTAKVLAESPDGWANAQPLLVRLQVQRRGDTVLVAADTSGGGPPVPLVEVRDSTYRSSAFLGLRFTYTATRSQAFGADDVLAQGWPYQDTTAPGVVAIHNPGKQQLHLRFSEPTDTLAGLWWAQLEGLGQAVHAQGGGRDWTLTWPAQPPTGQWINLNLMGWVDTAGNVLQTQLPAMWNLYAPGMVYISEIMADPDPAVGLPPVEYLELAWDSAIDHMPLNGWTVHINQAVYPLQGWAEGGTWDLLATDATAYPNAHPMGWSTAAFLNGGATVKLVDPLGQCASEVAYTDDWYADGNRSAGGWSLEARQPDPYPHASAWGASRHPAGGTPGAPNSVRNPAPLAQPRAYPLARWYGDTAVGMTLTRPAWDSALFNPALWQVSAPGSIARISREGPQHWLLHLQEPLGDEPLRIRPPAPYHAVEVVVGRPTAPRAQQALLSEVLYEPRSGGAECIELYAGDGFLDLSKLMLADVEPATGAILSTYRITDEPYLVPPGMYVALTEDTTALRAHYRSGCLLLTDDWPGLNNDGGTVGVVTTGLEVIEAMTYDPDMHFELLEATAGFSLERVSRALPAHQRDAWHSAAQLAGGATPGLPNSQQVATHTPDKAFALYPDPITPNGDGWDDVLTVAYRFPEPGYAVTIHIYDLGGNLISTLANNALAATEGLAVWNATQGSGQLVSTGSYVVWMQAVHPSGNRILERASTAVSH